MDAFRTQSTMDGAQTDDEEDEEAIAREALATDLGERSFHPHGVDADRVVSSR